MEVLLDKIRQALKTRDINYGQALYMIYLFNEEDFKVTPDNLLKLVEKGYVNNGRVTKKFLTIESVIEGKKVTGTLEPIYKEKLSNEAVRRLCATFCVYDKDRKVIFPGDIYDTVEKTAEMFLDNEQKLAYYFMIFLYLFPIQSKHNRKWEKFFISKPYSGPALRVRSKKLGAKFKKEARRKDMGGILYATFLYVQSATSEGKPFVKTPMNFLSDDFEEWYGKALMELRKANSVRELFKRRNNGGSMYTMI